MVALRTAADPIVFVPKKKGKWRLAGYDTFSLESYPLKGEFDDRESAEKAAAAHLKKLEKRQPTSSSGGQKGIQDKVYIVPPDGPRYLYQKK